MKKRTKAIIRAAISVTELGILAYVIRKEKKLEKEVQDYDELVTKYKISEFNKSRLLEELDYCWTASYDTEKVTEILTQMGTYSHRKGTWFGFMYEGDRKEILGMEE